MVRKTTDLYVDTGLRYIRGRRSVLCAFMLELINSYKSATASYRLTYLCT